MWEGDYSQGVGGDSRRHTQHIDISDEVIAALVRDQHPDLASLDFGRRFVLDDHLTIRLGDSLCLNLPTVPGIDEAMASSAEWLDLVSAEWSFPAGIPFRSGEPLPDYPFHWEIDHWIPGSNAAVVEYNDAAALALGRALHQVHSAAPPSAPTGEDSGTTLARHRKSWHDLCSALMTLTGPRGERLDPVVFSERWESAVDTIVDVTPRWTHGNLDPRYAVSDGGHFAGIGAWWTFGAGDPAADLGAALLLVPSTAERDFFRAYGTISHATLERTHGYRLLRALLYATSANPLLWRLGWARLTNLANEGAPH